MRNIQRSFLFLFSLLTCALPCAGASIWDTPPRLPTDVTPTFDEWISSHTQAIAADSWRETFTSPTLYHDLETTVPPGIRERMGIDPNAEVVRPVLGDVMVPGPVGRQPKGLLSGKIIYTTGGHGWTYDENTGIWYTQRPLTFDVVEDMGNIDQLNFFADLLWRVGATVVPLRPLGYQTQERILDNTDRHVKWQGEWYDATPGPNSLHFGQHDAKIPYRYAIATKDEASVARYAPSFDRSGIYPVYVWARDGADRVPQVYRVVHLGGCTEVVVDHSRVGKGWVWLGNFPFDTKHNGFVEVTSRVDNPQFADGKRVVIADAVRFGNGLGDINRSSGISGYPRNEECALYWIERMLPANGWPTHQYAEHDDSAASVGAPPRNTAYMNNEKSGTYFDRIFLSWHSNALDRAVDPVGRGATGLYCKSPELCTDFQKEYAEGCALVINDMLSSLTELGKLLPVPYDPFTSLTFSQINFGEIRRDYIGNEMCATIVEVAFHDDEQDAKLLRSPFVRSLFARGMVRNIANFMANHGALRGNKDLMPPGAPDMIGAFTETDGKARIVFRPAKNDEALVESKADGYMLYESSDGVGFNGGRLLKKEQLIPSALATDALEFKTDRTTKEHPVFFKVTAVNESGESRPSWTMGTYEGETTATRLCVASVLPDPTRMENADDLTLSQTVRINLHGPMERGGEIMRLAPDLTQTGNEVIAPSQALAKLKIGFDTASLRDWEVFANGKYPYAATIMDTGRREKLPSMALKLPMPAFISGKQLTAEALTSDDDDATETTGTDPLKVEFSNEIFGNLFADPRNMVLDADDAAKVLMYYGNSLDRPAMIKSGRDIISGFPFSNVKSSNARRDMMKMVLTHMGLIDPATGKLFTAETTAKPTVPRSKVKTVKKPVTRPKQAAKPTAQQLKTPTKAPTQTRKPAQAQKSKAGKSSQKARSAKKNTRR